MTKVTKNEKLLRKATGKWEKFLAEGAFKNQVDEDALYFGDDAKDDDGNPIDLERAAPGTMWKGKPMQIDDNGQRYIVKDDGERMYATISDEYFEEGKVNEMTMGERGMVDAQDGNPPSKIGHGNEEYMAAFNAVMKKMGKEPLPIVQPDQAYLDALQRGNLEEMGPATGHVEGTDAAGVIRQIAADLNEVSGVMNNASSTTTASEFAGFIQAKAAELLEAANELGIDGPAPALQENEKKSFEVGEFVYIIDGGLRGATGKIAEPTTLVTGEQGYVIQLYSDADKKVFGKQGDEVIAGASKIRSGGTFDGSELYDIDERSEDDERDLEPPVKYGSGAKLEFDPKEQEFYDRKRDMYIYDKEEEDNLTKEGNPSSFSMRTTHSSDPEMDQVMDIAADMLELGARSRVPVSLVGVESALQKQGFDTKMDKGVLIVDDKYVIADKSSLPASAQKISFTKYAADYLSNIEGEQLDLPMDEQENPDFVTSYSADPHLDQIEDYALTVIEKGGNLRQLEDVLNRDGFATFLNGDILTIDDEFFIGKEENFEISPNEDIRRVGPYVVGYSK